MFEETMLDGERTAKRWSVPVSMTLQVAAIAVVVLLPLIYGERLPALIGTKAVVYMPPAPPHPAPSAPAQHPAISHPVFNDRGLVAPVRIPPRPAMIVDSAPPVPGSDLIASGPATGVPGLSLGDLFGKTPPPPPAPPRPPETKAPPKPTKAIRVTSSVQAAKRTVFVMPVYPPIARAARISGTVELM